MSFALAIHGGAGTILKSTMTPEKEAAYHAGLTTALKAGHAVLKDGGAALDAVTAAVCALEDEPLFNAGRGAVYTTAGKQEMDASIMEGAQRRAGAIAGVRGPRNPIRLARLVMEKTEHVMLIGEGALTLARQQGLPFEEDDYFFTEARWKALQDTMAMRDRGADDHDDSRKHGTVGAVACDIHGNLAAATSTGGMTAKLPGRVGDSPVIGAGTWADNDTCAISATGHGEIFIRYAAAHEIASRMRYLGESLEVAADHVVMKDLMPAGGSGGLIAVGKGGVISLPFNSSGMYRGWVAGDSVAHTGIYKDDVRTAGL
ncbi:isoaspartyl peptidase/L-asparaginase family protein [Lacibacterium aquatile]|uniref:Isoaspartyl peptidase/L-asparaginase family protein n=1 Tax=Lacibacterium aquatile TaxID=1168082 RepID=A0ABW5DKD3_9PROT